MAMEIVNRFDLPDGEWAELRPAKKVPERLRRPVRLAAVRLQNSFPEEVRAKWNRPAVKVEEPAKVADEGIQTAFGSPPVDDLAQQFENTTVPSDEDDDFLPTPEQQELVDAYNEILLIAFVVSWSFSFPVSVGGVQELPGDAYDELVKEVRRLNAKEGEDDSLASDPS
jgi:hypothetical protein